MIFNNIYNYIKNILLFIVMFLWQLPQNLIALLILPFLDRPVFVIYKRKSICLGFDALDGKGSVSLGSFVFLSPAGGPEVTAHELGHVKDSHLFGPLYILVIGIPSLLHAALYKQGNRKSYYDFWTERRANNNSYLFHSGNNLIFMEGKSLDDISI